MLRGRRYNDRVRLYDRTQAEDEYGEVVSTFIDKGLFPADVTQLTGFRLLQYQQLGYNYAVVITLRILDFVPVKLMWGANEVMIRSVVPDLRTRETRIEGVMQESYILPTTTIAPTTTITPTTTNAD